MKTSIRYFYCDEKKMDVPLWDSLLAEVSSQTGFTIRKIEKDEAEAKDSDRRVMVVSGGDGSLNRAVNWLAKKSLLEDVEILYHPGGTGNDFARAVGLYDLSDIEVASLLTESRQAEITLGKFNDKYFINMATVGCFAEVTPNVNSDVKGALGVWSYYIKAMEKLASISSVDVQFTIDRQKSFDVECVGFFVGNSRFSGGGFQVTPDANAEEGSLDLLIVKDAPIMDLMSLGFELQKENPDLEGYEVIYQKMKKLDFVSDSALHFNLDGENYKEKKGKIRIEKKKAKICLPFSASDDPKKTREAQNPPSSIVLGS